MPGRVNSTFQQHLQLMHDLPSLGWLSYDALIVLFDKGSRRFAGGTAREKEGVPCKFRMCARDFFVEGLTGPATTQIQVAKHGVNPPTRSKELECLDRVGGDQDIEFSREHSCKGSLQARFVIYDENALPCIIAHRGGLTGWKLRISPRSVQYLSHSI